MYTIFLKRERKMFVICPKCAAKYQIPAEISLKEGQKVQCSACQHVFHFEKKQTIEWNFPHFSYRSFNFFFVERKMVNVHNLSS